MILTLLVNNLSKHEMREREDDERNNEKIKHYYRTLVECLADAYRLEILSDDNKSPLNGLSGLEQVIRFASKGMFSPFSIQRDLGAEVRRISIISDCRPIDDYLGFLKRYNQSTVNDPWDVESIGEDLFMRNLCVAMCENIVTDDHRSQTSGYTQLDQVILFYMGYMDESQLKDFKGEVYTSYTSLQGGSLNINIQGLSANDLNNLPKMC